MWRGFIAESKSWMGYPEHRVRFWIQFPAAFTRYSFYTVRDKLIQTFFRLTAAK